MNHVNSNLVSDSENRPQKSYFGLNLQFLRLLLGANKNIPFSQVHLSRKVGISLSTIQHWEASDTVTPRFQMLDTLCTFFNKEILLPEGLLTPNSIIESNLTIGLLQTASTNSKHTTDNHVLDFIANVWTSLTVKEKQQFRDAIDVLK